MSSVSFDPVAHVYDATRGYPEDVARQVAGAIDQAASGNAQTRWLEVGVGTGRIALPLAELGRSVSGVDISKKMLAQLERKARVAGWQEDPRVWGSMTDEDAARKPDVRRLVQMARQGSMRLVISDTTDLPFHGQSFDVVIAVYIFHLIDDWQKAVQEVLRVLRPGGILLRCWEEDVADSPGPWDMRREWSEIIEQLSGQAERPVKSAWHNQAVTAWLQQQGLQTERLMALEWGCSVTPRAIFEEIERRVWSYDWSVPDDIFAEALVRLRQWVAERYGSAIDVSSQLKRYFLIGRTRI
jgi:ubiquinone/menaquinone biosynthesis C-methylase UbiE